MAFAFGVFRLVDSTGVIVATAVKLDPAPPSITVANHVLLPDLESGACMSLEPTRAGPGQTVFIDPGHGGLDPGVVAGTTAHPGLEKDATLAVALRLSDLLRGAGYPLASARAAEPTAVKPF